MKKYFVLLLSVAEISLQAQTFSAGGGSIPDGGPLVSFPLTVSGLSPSTIDTVFGLETICLNITHTWDSDLNISLQAPDGTIVDLSIGNGGDGDDYANTCFNAYAAGSIASSGAPFTGTFRPQSFMGTLNNGQNGNGLWKLLIQDTYPADAGILTGWSITFGNMPAKPFNFKSSDLPIVVINTGGVQIPNEPKVDAYMGIIYNGPGVRNFLSDPFNNYSNKIGIELRGSTSQGFPQKPYGIETRDITNAKKDTMLLGMPKEHDWILYAPYDDKTCMRNVLSYDIANKTGHYASRTQFCELVLNGQYMGIYVVMEKIKRDNNRVSISKLTAADTTGDALSGGYIFKIDRDAGAGSYWTSAFPSSTGAAVNFVYDYPKPGIIVPKQEAYIQSYVDSFEVALNGPAFADTATGFRKFISVSSFIDYFILNEISKNVDGYRLSTYLYKDKRSKGGKLRIGPAWDYNLAWWNADYCDGSVTTGWAYQFNSVCGGDFYTIPFWWDRLLQDPAFEDQLKCRWVELRQTTLSDATLSNYVDSLASYLNEAQQRHFTAWPILGVYTWPNPAPIPGDYAGEITALKSWIIYRCAWLDANMPGICNVGIDEHALAENELHVYPNPFSNKISLDYYLPENGKVNISITDVLGKIVFTTDTKDYPKGRVTQELDLSAAQLNQGVYFLKLSTQGGMLVKKLDHIRE